MAAFIPGLQIFQPQEQTTEYQQKEPFWAFLKRKLMETVPFMRQELTNFGNEGYLPPSGSRINLAPVRMDQNFRPVQDQSANVAPDINPQFFQGNFMQPQGIGQRIFTGPGNWWEMKSSRNPNQLPQGMMTPPPPPPVAQGAITPMQPPEQTPVQQAQAPVPMQMPFMFPQNQGPQSFQDYYKMIQEMQPKQEKSWMNSPLYPFAMAMMGLGQQLMTPPATRGQINFMNPMMMALHQQQQMKQQESPRSLFEKAVASYPHYIQATRTQAPKMRFVLDAQGNVKGVVPGEVTTLPAEQQNWIMTQGTGGATQFVPGPGGKLNVIKTPEATAKETPPYVVPYVTDQGVEFRPVPQGVKPTAPVRQPQQQWWQQFQNQKQIPGGGNRPVNIRNQSGQIVFSGTEDEARKRGFIK